MKKRFEIFIVKNFFLKFLKKRKFIFFKFFIDIKICKSFLKFLIFLKKEKSFSNFAENDLPVEYSQYSEYLTIEGIRKKFENFLEIWGLDFNQSQKIWNLYLNFEFENLKNLEKNFVEKNENENGEKNFAENLSIKKTENLIRSIFRRRISFPHIDLDIIWKEYKLWEKNSSEENLTKMEIKYKESSKKCEAFLNFEEKFEELIELSSKEDDTKKLNLFLKIEIPKISEKYFNYGRLYFEKALEYNCDSVEIWEMYINYTKDFLKNSANSQNFSANVDKAFLLSIMFRSCKCCFFSVELWKILILEMEENYYAKVEIQSKKLNFFLLNFF